MRAPCDGGRVQDVKCRTGRAPASEAAAADAAGTAAGTAAGAAGREAPPAFRRRLKACFWEKLTTWAVGRPRWPSCSPTWAVESTETCSVEKPGRVGGPGLRRVPEALGRVGGHLGGWCQRPRRPRRPRQVELTNDRGPTADLSAEQQQAYYVEAACRLHL